ncbi:MAG TPA: dihydrolipoyl dehydrogenase [Thermotogota bacterium]|nr:dihydrolipoyl dehydrogenase [Thermotogota bacterium]HRW33437.1 dihydrolipoyl dehydrogenase [Thermotogota bacterium]
MKSFELVIIGAGPGGYVGAIRAAQLGIKTAVIEKDKPGGVCLNIGCIPSKALIHQAEKYNAITDLEKMGMKVDRTNFDYKEVHKKSRLAAKKLSKGVEFLLKKNQVDYIEGEAVFEDRNTILVNGEQIHGDHIVIATGSRPKQIPGFEIDEENVISSTGALMLEKLPEKMLILGSGAIGVEFSHIFNSFGVEVHLVEMLDSIIPTEDRDISEELEKAFKKRKIKVYTSTKATGYEKTEHGLTVHLKDKNDHEVTVAVDKILLAVGRSINIENLGLEKIGIELERGNFIKVGDYYETTVKGVYAVGDVVSSPLLAHVASKEAEIAVEHIAGKEVEKRLDPLMVPGAVYCEPEIGSFGLKEKDIQNQAVIVSKFPYKAIGKATAVEQSEGFIKILTEEMTGKILGASIIGAQATELIHELLLAKDNGLSAKKIASMIHAHPTLSEGLMEASRASQGWAIHI